MDVSERQKQWNLVRSLILGLRKQGDSLVKKEEMYLGKEEELTFGYVFENPRDKHKPKEVESPGVLWREVFLGILTAGERVK